MRRLFKPWHKRVALTLVPLVLALLHAVGLVPLGILPHLDDVFYDARLRLTMPDDRDDRIVIVDFDERSIAAFGWPWNRQKLAALTDELFERQHIALAGFDMVFLEPDESSGLRRLQALAKNELRGQANFGSAVAGLEGALDYDAMLTQSLRNRAVVLGYYFTNEPHGVGVLPAPVSYAAGVAPELVLFPRWDGYGANIRAIAAAAPCAGFFNSRTDEDGTTRSLPLIAEHAGRHYEALSLAMFRQLRGLATVSATISRGHGGPAAFQALESIELHGPAGRSMTVPVDGSGAALVPFRGPGGVKGGSYRYVSAVDVLNHQLPEGSLAGKIVLVGTTAPGLHDLRTTPVGAAYPGVEIHANLLSALLDGRIAVRPVDALGYEVLVLLFAGVVLAASLPRLQAGGAALLGLSTMGAIVGLNFWLYASHGLVLPLASSLLLVVTALALNMGSGYFVEGRTKRGLAKLFGAYVPPELVNEMLKNPDGYSMKAANKELTVMFCDIRGFTHIAEDMAPIALQALMNEVFDRLTAVIRRRGGTIDKYMGDCVMAFWGAPVNTAGHAHLAVQAAFDMIDEMRRGGRLVGRPGKPDIGLSIGLSTGTMCVGDMGSPTRRSYTVIGDAVNLGARLEGLTAAYGVDLIVSEATRQQADTFVWQELDRVRVKGKEQAVAVYAPMARADQFSSQQAIELTAWNLFLLAYRRQDWTECQSIAADLQRSDASKFLYQLYAERVASMRLLPFDPGWDGATSFETK